MPKPELLVPAGSVEAFYAALEAGADAVYLGLRRFNARERAKNFTVSQVKAILSEASEKGVKVYITLNTLIKNSEIPELFDVLLTLEKIKVDAIIIQDLGLYYLVAKYFPRLKLHASTQMGNHNSLGAAYCQILGMERVILARELTFPELQEIKKKTSIDLEVFIHGALCYSFSGMCLFSSYLGGMSANRGNCRQPCRRKYKLADQESYFFNLKDNQQADQIRKLTKLGIRSLKIEGRMKPADYVYNAALAYRQLLDENSDKKESYQLLEQDLGRQKTGYFLAGNIKDAISEVPYTGKKAGEVLAVKPQLAIRADITLKAGDRLRILSDQGFDSKAFKIKKLIVQGNRIILPDIKVECSIGEQVFLVGLQNRKFPDRLQREMKADIYKFSVKRQQDILSKLVCGKPAAREELYFRINEIKWLRKLYLDKIDKLILNLDQQEMKAFKIDTPFLQNIVDKIIIQLPRFIAEKNLAFYQNEIKKFYNAGIRQYMLSHISQKLLFSEYSKLRLFVSENVYVLNDAAAAFLIEEQITNWVYPYENDFPNLIAGSVHRGIVPLLFYPELFYSRMPAAIPEDAEISDLRQNFHKKTRDGITIILPEHPVSLLQFHKRLVDKGFRRFLIDLSWYHPSTNTFNRAYKNYLNSTPEQPATNFNFKAGLT
ncbi:MAG: U32 family peptidase [Candidatus Cloacimonetes bacterium]|nr:U32 family peptidase [Candidatus Cloacimonadota bacterium]